MKNKKILNTADKIDRSDAIKKMGKYAALTAIGSLIFLSPQKAQAGSPEDPGTGF
jgi:hypothetical protein